MPNFINKMDWGSLRHEYELDAKRLLPWEVIQAPFEGAWCVVRPGTRSTPHSHHERELFIAISGQADIVIAGERFSVGKGDLISIPVGSEHYIANDSEEDFHMYTVWWSQESASEFLNTVEA